MYFILQYEQKIIFLHFNMSVTGHRTSKTRSLNSAAFIYTRHSLGNYSESEVGFLAFSLFPLESIRSNAGLTMSNICKILYLFKKSLSLFFFQQFCSCTRSVRAVHHPDQRISVARRCFRSAENRKHEEINDRLTLSTAIHIW